MTRNSQAKLRRRCPGPFCHWLQAVVIALLLVLPLFFFNFAENIFDSAAMGDLPDVMIVPLPGGNMSPDLRELYDWLKVAAPSYGAHPDYGNGFSHLSYGRGSWQPTVYPQHEIQLSAPKNDLRGTLSPDILELSSMNWSSPVEPVCNLEARVEKPGVYFRLPDGQLLDDMGSCPDKIMSHLDTASHITDIGLAEIIMPENAGDIVRVVLRRSCGDDILDIQGISMLIEYFNSSSANRANSGVRFVEIDWRRGAK